MVHSDVRQRVHERQRSRGCDLDEATGAVDEGDLHILARRSPKRKGTAMQSSSLQCVFAAWDTQGSRTRTMETSIEALKTNAALKAGGGAVPKELQEGEFQSTGEIESAVKQKSKDSVK